MEQKEDVDTLRSVEKEEGSPRVEQKWLSISEIAIELERHPNSVRSMIKKGQIPAYKIGGEYQVKRTEYQNWLEGQRVK